MEIACGSQVTRVVVYARGALVTRTLFVPAHVPDGDLVLVAAGIPPLADAGSARATVEGSGRYVLAVQSRWASASAATGAREGERGAGPRRLLDVEADLRLVRRQQDLLQSQREDLLASRPVPRLAAGGRRVRSARPRVEAALACGVLLDRLVQDLDARAAALRGRQSSLEMEAVAARLAEGQASTRERSDATDRCLEFLVRVVGEGPPGAVEVSYTIPTARWWPVYTLRLVDQGRRAEWIREALVAQLGGEDWTGVRVCLTTADLVGDQRLPELPSLRLGRAQAEPRRAFRPPPAGLDRMFEGYDRAFPGDDVAPTGELGPAPPPPPIPCPAPSTMASFGTLDAHVMAEPVSWAPPAKEKKAMPRSESPRRREVAGPGGGGAPPPEELPGVEPRDAWLDFDQLRLAPVANRARRGRLVLEPAGGGDVADARWRLESLRPAESPSDPRQTRGAFDRQYCSAGMVDIPSDGAAHRIPLDTAEGMPTIRWRTVPREAPEAYREAALSNPFITGLLPGPMDVFVEGSLVLATRLETEVGPGGTVYVGLGLEDRIRVARNVHVEEERGGILGDSTNVTHHVRLDLVSALGEAVDLEVLERLPVSDDKAVRIKVVSCQPESEPYSQDERHHHVRGGMRWRLSLPAGGRLGIEYSYRITLPGKSEIVGGNRRD